MRLFALRLSRLAPLLVVPSLACTLAVSTDGLAGPPLDPDPATDAATSALPSDAADASSDAGSFCDQQRDATFCADFDHDPQVAVGFTDSLFSGASPTLASTTDHVSAPFALEATTMTSSSNATSARLYRDLPFVARQLHVELDLRLCASNSGRIEFLKVETSSPSLRAPAPGYEVSALSLEVLDGAAHLTIQTLDAAGAQSTYTDALPLLPVGQWFHLSGDVSFATDATGTVRFAYDRAATPAYQHSGLQTLSASATVMRVIVGQYSSNSPTSCVSLVDNVLVDAAP